MLSLTLADEPLHLVPSLFGRRFGERRKQVARRRIEDRTRAFAQESPSLNVAGAGAAVLEKSERNVDQA